MSASDEGQQPPKLLPLDSDVQPRARAVLDYWFGQGFADLPWGAVDEQKQKIWYGGGPEVDAEIKQLFAGDLEDLKHDRLGGWTKTYERLAAIILADQFTRNAYRGTAEMYASDEYALQQSDQLLASAQFKLLQPAAQQFAVMPLMHSEDIAKHEQLRQVLLELLEEARKVAGGEPVVKQYETQLRFADAHTACIRRWGRYPHRNIIVGRPSTPEEEAGMADGSIPAW